MEEMSERIEQITGQLFEAKLRLSDDHPSPEELVHILNGKALMVSMLRTRIQTVEKKAEGLYSGKTPEEKAALQAKYGIPDTFEDFFEVNGDALKMKKLQRNIDQMNRESGRLDPEGQAEQIRVLSTKIWKNKEAIKEVKYAAAERRKELKDAALDREKEDDKFKKIAAFLHEIGVPPEDAQQLCFNDYTLDSETYRNLLQDNPYLLFGFDPAVAKKAAALAKFFLQDRGEFRNARRRLAERL